MDLTVIIPAYNAGKTIERTLQSLECIVPTHRSAVEVIAVNDGSNDESLPLLEQYRGRATFEHVLVIDKESGGSASARNEALRAATGAWLLFLDSDDELVTDPLPHIGAASPEISALLFAVERYRDNQRQSSVRPVHIDLQNHLDVMTAGNPFVISSVIFRADYMDQMFDARFISREDWHFWSVNPRIFSNGLRLPHVTSSRIHAHDSNKSANRDRAGRFRAQVAEQLMRAFSDRLTAKQKNNLLLQVQVGRIQQGHWPTFRSFVRWPCCVTLWLKLVGHAILGNRVRLLEFYR